MRWADALAFAVVAVAAVACAEKASTPAGPGAPAELAITRDQLLAEELAETRSRQLGLIERAYLDVRLAPTLLRQQTWVHGEPADDDDPGAHAVGAIVFTTDGLAPGDSRGIAVHCSAIAIGAHVIATAAHCLTSRPCDGSTGVIDPTRKDLYFVQGANAKRPLRASRIAIRKCHPDFRPLAGCDADLAIARLEEPLPAGAWFDGGLSAPDATTLVKLGYGYFLESGDFGSYLAPGLRGMARLTVQAPAPGSRRYEYSGRAPDGSVLRVCAGDSGGPGLQLRAGGLELVGVTSTYVPASHGDLCGPRGRDTQLGTFEPWYSTTLAELASTATGTSTCR